ncbi:MAG: hypothetical protein A2383_00495 [Candidatus Pacebacteria bacterium RIFOXYB1_FULL_39_46]|nr:MAG: hypothetical protein A2182_00325 [Candidatus Pacebacteria bacterium RIFOXYA1_FULL_38_18]OGJ38067.1 MAG: hypothetical protein A2383_00495 [Candidatus Pacebacteria bacterium RIFOXYB1_FULL_39_46]OGJ39710.1 MAG: hypothetical protein A2411_02950 [Candidatus Pacebacteria bacterium RIFOXYC1_FULL_39_21]
MKMKSSLTNQLTKFFLSLTIVLGIFLGGFTNSVIAVGQITPTNPKTSDETSIFGTIEAPAGVDRYNAEGEGGIGLITFISNLIRLATVAAGVWVLINFILAGWQYIISSGDSKGVTQASSMMTNSLVGLGLIVGAYTIAAIIGLIFFGDATYIINPTLRGVS